MSEYEKKLEERIHQELVKLPERTAPEGLVNAVLTRIKEQEARPWWRRPIPDWPRRNQFVFVTVMLALVASSIGFLWQVWPHEVIQEIPSQAAAAVEPVRPFFSVAEMLGRAGALLLQSVSTWVIGIAVALFFGYASCIGMGMAWYRVTFQKGLARA